MSSVHHYDTCNREKQRERRLCTGTSGSQYAVYATSVGCTVLKIGSEKLCVGQHD